MLYLLPSFFKNENTPLMDSIGRSLSHSMEMPMYLLAAMSCGHVLYVPQSFAFISPGASPSEFKNTTAGRRSVGFVPGGKYTSRLSVPFESLRYGTLALTTTFFMSGCSSTTPQDRPSNIERSCC